MLRKVLRILGRFKGINTHLREFLRWIQHTHTTHGAKLIKQESETLDTRRRGRKKKAEAAIHVIKALICSLFFSVWGNKH